jgi:protein-tyrosine-phosphatase
MEVIKRTKVLFVCFGNSCRSPMAEAIANRLAADVMEASSAGLTALGQVQSMTKETLLRNGYLADDLESKQLQIGSLRAVDLIVNMTGRTAFSFFHEVDKVEDWDVEDPYGADAETYQRIFEDIERRVAKLADRLRQSTQTGDLAGHRQRGHKTG